MLTRTSFALLASALLASPALPQRAPETSGSAAKVVFVCEHGAAKSVIAAAHFNKLASEGGLPYRAVARGTNPDPSFSSQAVSGLAAEGLSAGPGKPVLVAATELSEAARVITLGCKLPRKAQVTDWADVPSVSENYSGASRTIRKHVEELLDELARKPAGSKQ